MAKLVIEIETDGEHCGECRLKEYDMGALSCSLFGGELKLENNTGYKRLYKRHTKCLTAEVSKEG